MHPMLHVHLLGQFLLRFDDTTISSVDTPRLQSGLAYLVLNRRTPLARAHLAYLLWPDSTEAQAHTNLRSLLLRLRRALPDADTFLQIGPQVVQWRPDAPFTLDVADVDQALVQVNQAAQSGDHVAMRAALDVLLARYHGDLMPGCYEEWILPERERLRQTVLAALEYAIPLLEDGHDLPGAILVAQRLLHHDPLHESTYQHLIRLHARSGDRASAVRAYQTCVTVLQRELGIEPSSAMQAAYEGLRHMEAPLEPSESRRVLGASLQPPPLPIPLTSLIGRAREQAEVRRLLSTTRLLTLTGTGGCGKTRLALAVAADLRLLLRDGVALVELAALVDGALIPQAVAQALGVRENPHQSVLTLLVELLRSKALLLVLDNCEHLIGACAQVVTTLLGACPELRILATSREALGIAGEITWLVPSLSLPDLPRVPRSQAAWVPSVLQSEAGQLFMERARAVLPTFSLTPQNAPVIAQICRRLDGIPLAIELAAARIKLLSVAQLAERLDDCFRLLSGGSRTALARHQTLRATIDWSYALLSAEERTLFRRLAAFAGGWTLETAEAVCEDQVSWSVLEVLAHLVDKSLVVVEMPPDATARYRFLETVRQYSQERLQEAGEAMALQARHAQVFLRLAETAAPQLWGAQQEAWLDQLSREHENLRAALHWSLAQGELELAARFAGALWRFWEVRTHLGEGRQWLERILAAIAADGSPSPPGKVSSRLHTKVLNGAGVLAAGQGEYRRARELLEASLQLCRQDGDQRGIAAVLNHLGEVAYMDMDALQTQACCTESLALYRVLDDRRGIARSLANLGMVAITQSEYGRARVLLEESVALERELNESQGLALALNQLAFVARSQGDERRAGAWYAESLARFGALQIPWGIAYGLEGIAVLAVALFHGGGSGVAPHHPPTAEWACGAARLWGAAEALREVSGFPMTPMNRAQYAPFLAAARAGLDETTFAMAWAEGQGLSMEAAIQAGLQVVDALQLIDPTAPARAALGCSSISQR